MSVNELTALLRDPASTWTERRTRLQGWRGDDACRADAAVGAAAIAYAVGVATVGLVLALILGVTATFVAITGICVPSMLFTVLWGAERACSTGLVSSQAPAEIAPR